MNVGIGQLGARLHTFWQGADRGLKVRLVVGVLLGAGLVGAVVFLTRPSYEPLFTNLTPADAGQVSQRLDELKVSYRLGGDGKSILVPREKVYDLRNRLAMEGLPKGSAVGFEIFDQTKLGVTDFERRVQYLRALQGELSRTIEQMDGIRSAAVQIVLPEDRLYQKDVRPPTASVLLDTVGQMGADKVRAIIHLVSHSVEGLTPENITVVDTSGQVLSDLLVLDNTPAGLTGSQLTLQRSVEREIERNVQTMLEAVLGRGMVVTRVRAELNFDQREVTNEFFQPVANEEGILRSIEELQKSFEGEGIPPSVPGTGTNIVPTYQAPATGSNRYEEKQTTRNYEVNQTREHLVVAPGGVRYLSVAVVVNGNLTPAQQRAIEAAVTNAVGLRPDRGDQISVVSFPFQSQPEAAVTAERTVQEQAGRKWLLALAAAGTAVVVLVVFLIFRRKRRTPAEVVPLPVGTTAAEEAAPTQEVSERERIRKDVERLARQRPQEVAQLLATWLSE